MACIQQNMILNGHMDKLVEEEKTMQVQLDDRYAQEEILWKQNSRIQCLKKVKKILLFSIELWSNSETIIGSSNCIITREKLFTPSNKSKGSSFITSRSCLRRQLLADMSPLHK